MIQTIASLTTEWAAWMLAMSWQVALLGCVVFLLDAVLRRAGWVRLRYLLWCLVALKLLLPPTLGAATSVAAPLAQEVAPLVGHAPAAPRASDVMPWLLALWVLGVGIGALRGGRRRLRFARHLAARGLAAPAWLEALARETATRIGLRRMPRVLVLPTAGGPAVFGLLRPVVVLPPVPLRPTPEERSALEHVLLHEFSHVGRGDLWAQALFGSLRALYWFHPVAHLAARRAHALREVCCDLSVASRLGDATPAYRATLLRVAAERLLPAESSPVGAGFFHPGATILARLRALEGPAWRHARRNRLASLATALLLGALLIPMATSDAASQAFGDEAHEAAVRDARALLTRTMTERGTYGCFHRQFAFQQLVALEESR